MTCHLTFQTSSRSWAKEISEGEYVALEASFDSKQGWPIYCALITPLRTDSHLAGNLFLPTCFNYVWKIENIALRILATLPAILLDAATFPLRLISLPGRLAETSVQSAHPVVKYLQNERAPKELTEAEKLSCIAKMRFDNGRGAITTRVVNLVDLPFTEVSIYTKFEDVLS